MSRSPSLLRWYTSALLASAAHAAPTMPKRGISMTPRTSDSILVGGNVTLRVMPLGASITWGQASTDGNGYREDLLQLLNKDGNPVTYVGSQTHGTMKNNENEGWPGYTISQVFDKAKLSVPKTLPNLVLINAGTNDCVQNVSISTAQDRMLEMMQWLWSNSPRATLVLSTLLVNKNKNTERNVEIVNGEFKTLVAQQQALSHKVVLVDMHGPDGPQLSDLVDGTHPNDAGYQKMANLWFAGIQDAASRGWLESPQALPS